MHKFSTDHFFVAYAKLRIANIFWYANSVRTVRSAAVLSSMGCEHGRMPACRSCFRTVNMSMLSSSPACVQMYPDSSYSYRTQCFLLHVRVGAVDWKILRLVHSDMIKVRGALPTLSLVDFSRVIDVFVNAFWTEFFVEEIRENIYLHKYLPGS